MASQSPMYRAFVEVVPEASGFTGALTGQVATAGTTAGLAGGKAAGGGLIAGFGKMLPVIGAALGAFALGDLIADAFGDAGDYEQAVGAVESVFGDSSKKIVKFSKTSGKSFGLTANQALSGAKDFGIFGKAAGLTGDDLADFSTDLLGLGADLAAFGNTTPEEAVTALAAGLRGESEPLRKYGVLLDDATLRARALEMGIYDGNGPLTAQQKILAASGEIFAQTATQQGQFSAESDTLAGKQAILAASWGDISTQLGTAFLPVAQEVTGWILEHLIPALEDFVAWLNSPETQDGLRITGEAIDNIGGFMQTMSDKLVIGQEQIGGFFGVVIDKFTTGGQQIHDFFDGLFGWFQSMSDKLALGQSQVFSFFGAIGDKFALGGQQIGEFASTVGQKVGDVIGFFAQLPAQIGAAMFGAARFLYSAGQDVIRGLINGIKSMVSDIYSAITDTVGGAIDWAKSLLGIASPSKVFMEIGAYTGEGFARGIASQYRMVQGAAAGLAGAAVPDMSNGSMSGTLALAGDGLSAYVRGEISYADAADKRALSRGRVNR